ncbi:unnamed protein product [Symbiodinium pilosum]|uniref:Uncharacterized protein n=1 Tax=Symbiodinium pilosum TaxID=2952 RepID=A0A812YN59_SYMPI|nr:unnamed protein product [Symbiodinium pilosum]
MSVPLAPRHHQPPSSCNFAQRRRPSHRIGCPSRAFLSTATSRKSLSPTIACATTGKMAWFSGFGVRGSRHAAVTRSRMMHECATSVARPQEVHVEIEGISACHSARHEPV